MLENTLNSFYASLILLATVIVIAVAVIIIAVTIKTVKDIFDKKEEQNEK